MPAALVPGCATGGRCVRVDISHEPPYPLDEATLVEERESAGERVLTLHAHPSVGWRLDAPAYARWVVAADGRRVAGGPVGATGVASAPTDGLLHAAALPLAATLQGIELLHATAVVVDGRAVLVAGPSGVGKSSVGAHLCAGGATFLADDAAGLDRSGGEVIVHPGPQTASLHAAEAARLGVDGGTPAAGGKLRVAVSGAESHVQLGLVVFLERSTGGVIEIAPHDRPIDAFLGTNFVPAVRGPARLKRLLDLAASLTAAVPVMRIRSPASAASADTADAVRAAAA